MTSQEIELIGSFCERHVDLSTVGYRDVLEHPAISKAMRSNRYSSHSVVALYRAAQDEVVRVARVEQTPSHSRSVVLSRTLSDISSSDISSGGENSKNVDKLPQHSKKQEVEMPGDCAPIPEVESHYASCRDKLRWSDALVK